MSLPNPFPSSPARPPVVNFYTSVLLEGEGHRRFFTVDFAQLYAAKRWLELMMGDETAARCGAQVTLDKSGIRIISFQLDAVLKYEYRSDEEKKWELPESYARMIARFRRGTWFNAERDELHESLIIKPVKVKVEKIKRPANYVTVTELCKGTSVKPMNARMLLRSVMPKPDFGWAFPPEKLPEVKKIIGV